MFRLNWTHALIQALIYAINLTIARILIQEGATTPTFIGSLVLGFFPQLTFGLAPGFLLTESNKHPRHTPLAYGMILIGTLVSLACYQYEASIGYLPSWQIIAQYVHEARHIESSLIDPSRVIVASIVSGGVILTTHFAQRIVRSRFRTENHRTAILVSTSSVVTLIGIHIFAVFTSSSEVRSAVLPGLWIIQSASFLPEVDFSVDDPSRVIARVQQLVGRRRNSIPIDAPFCGQPSPNPDADTIPNHRSVIVVVLESVGTQEADLVVNGQRVMPQLASLRDRNLSFSSAYASSTRSAYALVEILSGVLPQAFQTLLWREPLPYLEGIPGDLHSHGYATSYFHGGNLKFENQGTYLSNIGFRNVFEFDPAVSYPKYGWGWADEVVFSELRRWVALQKEPYFGMIFTLSTHDPFRLPESFNDGVFGDTGPTTSRERFIDSLRYLDGQLGQFYEWYEAEEKPSGTILIVTGDHPGTISRERGWHISNNPELFKVPLVIAGQELSEKRSSSSIAERLAGHLDIPTTLASLLRIPANPCFQGRNLLAEAWEEPRYLYAVHGDAFENLHVWSEISGWSYEKKLGLREAFMGSSPEPNPDIEFLSNSLQPVSYMLFDTGIYFRANQRKERTPTPSVSKPIFVAHRGNTNGPRGDTDENKPHAIEEAITRGFDWIEVDLLMTGDNIPIVMHDGILRDLEGTLVDPVSLDLIGIRQLPHMHDLLTLAELLERYGDRVSFALELKKQHTWNKNRRLAQEVLRILRSVSPARPMVIDSFDGPLITWMGQNRDFSTAWDLPLRGSISEHTLYGALEMEVDWIYVEHSRASPALIRRAHELGLKVMLYTMRKPHELHRFRSEWPDGIMIDDVQVRNAFHQWSTTANRELSSETTLPSSSDEAGLNMPPPQ